MILKLTAEATIVNRLFLTPEKLRHSISIHTEKHLIYSKIILENFETFFQKKEMQKNIWKIEAGLY